MGQVLAIDQQSFKNEVLESDLPVLVDFWAPWCGPCRMVAPVMEELATELAGKVKVVKIDVDENAALAGEYKVMSIPTILLMKKGQIVQQMQGFSPKATILSKLQEHL
jgi:thioredoxin 1